MIKFQGNSLPDFEKVRQNGLLLRHVKNQTPEICLAAVKQNNDVLSLITDEDLFVSIATELGIETDLTPVVSSRPKP
jgi:hypothetical protein